MASKTESTLRNMLLALFLVALASATSLGYIYELTKGPIETAKLKKKLDAIQLVVPEFTNNPNDDIVKVAMQSAGDTLEIYPAYNNDKFVGAAIRTYSDKAFTSRIYIMVGFLPDGIIHHTQVLEHKETPGLGDKMTTDKFKNQFKGKNPKDYKLLVSKDGGKVDAITAATISSRAFTDAVDRAYKTFMENKEALSKK